MKRLGGSSPVEAGLAPRCLEEEEGLDLGIGLDLGRGIFRSKTFQSGPSPSQSPRFHRSRRALFESLAATRSMQRGHRT